MRTIPLTQNEFATVCDCHYDLVSSYKWTLFFVKGKKYAFRQENDKSILMHRIIAGTKKGFYTDHKDDDGLNNQCSNLRIATNAQNMQNVGPHKNNTSGYKGVCWVKSGKHWRASIRHNGRRYHFNKLGTAQEAAAIYSALAAMLHGEFAHGESV